MSCVSSVYFLFAKIYSLKFEFVSRSYQLVKLHLVFIEIYIYIYFTSAAVSIYSVHKSNKAFANCLLII